MGRCGSVARARNLGLVALDQSAQTPEVSPPHHLRAGPPHGGPAALVGIRTTFAPWPHPGNPSPCRSQRTALPCGSGSITGSANRSKPYGTRGTSGSGIPGPSASGGRSTQSAVGATRSTYAPAQPVRGGRCWSVVRFPPAKGLTPHCRLASVLRQPPYLPAAGPTGGPRPSPGHPRPLAFAHSAGTRHRPQGPFRAFCCVHP